MIKKVKVSELVSGMFVHNMNCDWLEHPFVKNSFLIQSPQDIKKIADLGIKQVYIDTEQGVDASEAPTIHDVQNDLNKTIKQIGQTDKPLPRQLSCHDELIRAQRILDESNDIVRKLLKDIRLGRQVRLEQIQPIVSTITHSIFRNPDALISLYRIKQADNYTYQHSIAVCALLVSFCKSLEMEYAMIEQVGIGGLLHDIGKMKVPAEILNKPGKLSEKEFSAMKKHVAYGGELLKSVPEISQPVLQVVMEHHERHDGTGYPNALQGEQISLYGQMAAIVDVYDALTSNRVYHQGMEPTAVLHKLLEWSEHHFNPELVHYFIRTVGIYPVGSLVRLSSQYLAIVIDQHHENLLHPKVRVIFNTRNQSYVPPRDIDLANPAIDDQILSFEIPTRWHIDPYQHF